MLRFETKRQHIYVVVSGTFGIVSANFVSLKTKNIVSVPRLSHLPHLPYIMKYYGEHVIVDRLGHKIHHHDLSLCVLK